MIIGGDEVFMCLYEIMVIFDLIFDECIVVLFLEMFFNVVCKDGGKVEKVDIWGKCWLVYEIVKYVEGIYVVIDVKVVLVMVFEFDC